VDELRLHAHLDDASFGQEHLGAFAVASCCEHALMITPVLAADEWQE
jgi:hypothetical protein